MNVMIATALKIPKIRNGACRLERDSPVKSTEDFPLLAILATLSCSCWIQWLMIPASFRLLIR